jgi:WD40 repeat protein
MREQLTKPRDFDAVLGGSRHQLLSAVVLGGIAGVGHRLATPDRQQRNLALHEAVSYGTEGLELVIDALQDPDLEATAFILLRDRHEPQVIEALTHYQPYRLFGCLHQLQTSGTRIYGLEVSEQNYITCICKNHSPDHRLNHKLADRNTNAKHLEIWDAESGQLLKRESINARQADYKLRSPFRYVSADQKIMAIASGESRTILVLSSSSTDQLSGHDAGVYAVAVSDDGKTLISGSDDGEIKVWDLPTMTEIASLAGHDARIRAVAISSDHRFIVSGSNDGVIKVWGVCV